MNYETLVKLLFPVLVRVVLIHYDIGILVDVLGTRLITPLNKDVICWKLDGDLLRLFVCSDRTQNLDVNYKDGGEQLGEHGIILDDCLCISV